MFADMHTVLLIAVFPFVAFSLPAAVAAFLSLKPRWSAVAVLLPLVFWMIGTVISSRASSLSNLAFEPRLLSYVLNIAVLPVVFWSSNDLQGRRRFLAAVVLCSVFAGWVGLTFPELQE
jgi:FtsH-binding integral membrane protein